MKVAASLRFEALGAECELWALAPAEPLDATAEWIHGLHRRLTRFDPESELSRFNARPGEWLEVSSELETLLREALTAYEASGGLVHVGILPALVEAGYDRTFRELATSPAGDVPQSPHACLDEVSRPPRGLEPLPALLQVRPGRARLERGAAVDLGGLAKGWIADRAVERMGSNSLANCGGDLRALGGGPSGEGWPVAFGGRTLLLDDHGAATSGTAKRRWGEGKHHLIDPRTGAPAVTDLSEASVLARTALDAEVLAKTAILLGSALAPSALGGRALGWALA
ncbi:MAG: FAD:protein FMN transferase [Chloroflexi bacterium]|nr:FAD:protein FMN transferase [Chloroflexota bacterium]